MEPLQNAYHANDAGVFMIGDTEVRVIPGHHSIFSFYDTDAFQETKPKLPQKKDKYYRCTHCSYTTTWSGSFKRHFMCRHTDVKPYSCSECGYRTADIGNLKKHVTARHTSERAFQCLLCPYGTINLSHLRRHVANQHVGERPYSCPACNYAAGQNSDLRKHVQAKHPMLSLDSLPSDDRESSGGEESVLSEPPALFLKKNKQYSCFHCNFSSKLFKKLKFHILVKHFSPK